MFRFNTQADQASPSLIGFVIRNIFIFNGAHELASLGSVRQYRILQSGFVTPFGRELRSAPVHCCRYRQPACHLLAVRELNPPVRVFHPLENCTPVVYTKKIICIFKLFLQLTTSVRCMMLIQGAHEPSAEQCGQFSEAGIHKIY